MTPKEKWDRLQNPKTPEDYGLCLTETELRQFPEGRSVLLGVRTIQRTRANGRRFGRKMGEAMGKTMDRIIMGILT